MMGGTSSTHGDKKFVQKPVEMIPMLKHERIILKCVLKKTGCDGVDCIHQTQDREHSGLTGKLFRSRATVKLSSRTILHGVS
jgi:hypothetical protein